VTLHDVGLLRTAKWERQRRRQRLGTISKHHPRIYRQRLTKNHKKILTHDKLNGIQYKIITRSLGKPQINSPAPGSGINQETTPLLCATARHLTKTSCVWSFGNFREEEIPRESDRLLTMTAQSSYYSLPDWQYSSHEY